MQFDPGNNVIKRCARGMQLEGEGKPGEALAVFQQAWEEAGDDVEKFISAHYVARHQDNVADKLKWDQIAISCALRVEDDDVKAHFPSLYLNVGKCYEDLHDHSRAITNYHLALMFCNSLPDDGYGRMVKKGIVGAIKRLQPQT